MSKQLADKIQRILETSLIQINTGKTKKAFENLAKAEKLLEKAKRPDYQCSILMLKGRAFLAEQRNEEALEEFQKLMEFACLSSWMLRKTLSISTMSTIRLVLP